MVRTTCAKNAAFLLREFRNNVCGECVWRGWGEYLESVSVGGQGAVAAAAPVLAWDEASFQLKLVDAAGSPVGGQCAGDHGGLAVQPCAARTTMGWAEKVVPS